MAKLFIILLLGGSLALHPGMAIHVAMADEWEEEVEAAIAQQAWEKAVEVLNSVLDAEPAHLEARRLRGLCYRELARQDFRNLRAQLYLAPEELVAYREEVLRVLEGHSWQLMYGEAYIATKAMLDFEFVLSQDSSYRDVLRLYAQFWHDHEVLEKALVLGEAHLSRHPEDPLAHVELVGSYRHYIDTTNPREVLNWLEEHPSNYSDYFTGEVYRKGGQFQRAGRQFRRALENDGHVPELLIALSQARIALNQGRYEDGFERISTTLQVRDLIEARLLLEEYKYVLTPDENRQLQTLESVQDFAGFFNTMWTRRNPMPASRINWRLVEHYRRMEVAERDYRYYGGRTWFTSPDAHRELDFPSSYELNHGLNDKGVIYVRHGEPDERVVTVHEKAPPNESWRYVEEGMDFHFVVSSSGRNWRFTPVITNCQMLEDRRHWGGYYVQMAPPIQIGDPRSGGNVADPCRPGAKTRNAFDVIDGRTTMAEESRIDLQQGLTTDRLTWPESVERFNFPLQLAMFKGARGQTDVMVYYALPIGRLSSQVASDTLKMEMGVAVHDTAWAQSISRSFLVPYLSEDDPDASSIGQLQFSLPADTFRISLHSDLMLTPWLGSHQFGQRITNYARPVPAMSDVLLAYAITPQQETPRRRQDLRFSPNPFHRFYLDEPVNLYFELYNLGFDVGDKTRFSVEYALIPEKRGLLSGLRNQNKAALSVTAEVEEDTSSPIQFAELDVRDVAAGNYTLTVRINDKVTGQELTRHLALELIER